MEEAVVIDASVLVSWLVTSDANHEASRTWFERYKAKGGLLVAPALIVIEIASAIARPTRQPEIAKAAVLRLYTIRTLRLVSIGPTLARAAVNVAADFQLRARDTTYVAIAQKLNLPLVSWDKEQLHRATSIITTYSPERYPFS